MPVNEWDLSDALVARQNNAYTPEMKMEMSEKGKKNLKKKITEKLQKLVHTFL